MTRLDARLQALEKRKAASLVPASLGHFYDLLETTDQVGGALALVGRIDAGALTDADRAAVAAVPGGIAAIRTHVSSISHFYGGNP